jgi:hypothetical protein
LRKAVPELRGGDAGDHPPVSPAAPAARWPVPGSLASLGPRLLEVEVFDHDCPRPGCLCGGDEVGDGGAEPSVAGGCGQRGQFAGYLELSCQPVL